MMKGEGVQVSDPAALMKNTMDWSMLNSIVGGGAEHAGFVDGFAVQGKGEREGRRESRISNRQTDLRHHFSPGRAQSSVDGSHHQHRPSRSSRL